MTMAVPAKDRVQPDTLEDRYAQVVERIAQGARRAGRKPRTQDNPHPAQH